MSCQVTDLTGIIIIGMMGLWCVIIGLHMIRVQRRSARNANTYRSRRLSNDSLHSRPLPGKISAVAEEEKV